MEEVKLTATSLDFNFRNHAKKQRELKFDMEKQKIEVTRWGKRCKGVTCCGNSTANIDDKLAEKNTKYLMNRIVPRQSPMRCHRRSSLIWR